MIFSTKRDELGNVSGFMGPIGQIKASVEAKKAQINTDVLGLNRVLQITGGDKKLPPDELAKQMSDCSEAAIKFAKNAELSDDSIKAWAETSKKAADDSLKFSTNIKRLGTSLKNLGLQMGAMFANMLVAAAVSKILGIVIDMSGLRLNIRHKLKETAEEAIGGGEANKFVEVAIGHVVHGIAEEGGCEQHNLTPTVDGFWLRELKLYEFVIPQEGVYRLGRDGKIGSLAKHEHNLGHRPLFGGKG